MNSQKTYKGRDKNKDPHDFDFKGALIGWSTVETSCKVRRIEMPDVKLEMPDARF